MAALNRAILIPGLIMVLIIFWLWIPIWLVVWCVRRASGSRATDVELQSGHIPHKGFQPPPESDWMPSRPDTRFISKILRNGRHHFHNAEQELAYEQKHSIVAAAAREEEEEEEE